MSSLQPLRRGVPLAELEDAVGGEVGEVLLEAGRPADVERLDARGGAEAEPEPEVVRGQIARAAREDAHLLAAARPAGDAGADGGGARAGPAEAEAEPVAARGQVAEDRRRGCRDGRRPGRRGRRCRGRPRRGHGRRRGARGKGRPTRSADPNRPPPRPRNACGGWAIGLLSQGWSSTWPLVMKRSGWPSLSKSGAATPNPVTVRLEVARFAAQGRVREEAVAEVVEEGVGLVEEVGDEEVGRPVAVEVVGDDPHAGGRPPRAVQGDAGGHARLLEPEAAAVEEEEVGREVVGDEEVEPAVAVEVGDRQAEAAAVGGGVDPGLAADVGEGAVPVVAEEQVGLRRESRGRAVQRPARAVPAGGDVDRVGLDVGDDDEVEVAVAVEVAEAGRRRPAVGADAGALGDVLERPVPPVPVQHGARRGR